MGVQDLPLQRVSCYSLMGSMDQQGDKSVWNFNMKIDYVLTLDFVRNFHEIQVRLEIRAVVVFDNLC